MKADMNLLRKLAKIRALSSQQRLEKLRSRERELQGEIARLNQLRLDADMPSQTLLQMRGVGADLLWKAWISRKQAEESRNAAVVAQQAEAEQKKQAERQRELARVHHIV